MRIAIIGTAGIGKTTLASALSEILSLPLIKEDLGEVVQAVSLLNAPHPAPVGQGNPIEICRNACRRWLAHRQGIQEKLPGFVQDRCAIDILQRWLLLNLSEQDNMATLEIIRQTRALVSTLDWVIIPPFNMSLEKENEASLTRSHSLSLLFRGQSLTIGVAQMCVPRNKLLLIPATVRSRQERIDFVLDRVRRGGRDI